MSEATVLVLGVGVFALFLFWAREYRRSAVVDKPLLAFVGMYVVTAVLAWVAMVAVVAWKAFS